MRTTPFDILAVVALLSIGCSGHDYIVNEKEGRLVVSPGLVDLDASAVGSETGFSLAVQSASGLVEILAVEVQNVSGEWFSVVTEEFPELYEGEEAQVLDFLYAPMDEGWHWGTISLYTDEEEEMVHEVDVRALADHASAWLSPSILDFGPVYEGETGESSIRFENTCGLDIEILSISGPSDPFWIDAELPLVVYGWQTAEFDVGFSPSDLEEATDELVFELDIPVDIDPVTLRGNACSTASGSLYDQDGDGFGWCADDCDDRDASSNPGATEEVDGLDNDCDGIVDNGTSAYDDDGDGYSEDDGDCNDADENVNPDASETPGNGVDDDCDGRVDSGEADLDNDGYSTSGGDCDDTDATAAPGQPEIADGVDNDCDGVVDEGTTAYDDDGDGFTEAGGDCDDTDANVYPGATEDANWIDDDCDGAIDDGTEYADDDADGFSEIGGDCDDADASINPGAYDAAGDGIDSDCDGEDG